MPLPPSRENVVSVRSCIAKMEIQLRHLVKSLDDHREESKKNTELLHQRINTKTEEIKLDIREKEKRHDKDMEGIVKNLGEINVRHAKADGAKGVKGAWTNASLILIAGSVGGGFVSLFAYVLKALSGG